ncbi:class I SAM-dependent methyltransferase [bacterium]|nr:class I SAM-dependent methyltransferase [bacterium]
MKNYKEYTESNRQAWNQAMPFHKEVMDDKWDSLLANADFIFQKDPELAELNQIGISGKDIAHLSCNNGLELMSLKRLGANKCFGFDISDVAIEEAVKRAEKFAIDCQFIRSDVLEIGPEYFGNFDLVYITVGALAWIPDKRKYFEIAYNLLRPKGEIFIYEHHPFGDVFPYDDEYKGLLEAKYKYFNSEIYTDNTGIDYYGGKSYDSHPTYEFSYTISDLINILADLGFTIKRFNEYPDDIALGRSYLNPEEGRIPLSYIMIAQK